MVKPLGDKSNNQNDGTSKEPSSKENVGTTKDVSTSTTNYPIQSTTTTESKPMKTKNKLINKLSLTGISTSSNTSNLTDLNNDRSSNKENGKNGKNKKAVSAQNSQEMSTAESPPPVQLQKKKKLSFRQRLTRCGSGCKNKVTKKNSNEMELENVSTSNNDLTGNLETGGPSNEKTNPLGNRTNQLNDQQTPTNSPKLSNNADLENNDVEINSPSANTKLATTTGSGGNGNQNLDANHCARNFFCWCCSCCSCLK